MPSRKSSIYLISVLDLGSKMETFWAKAWSKKLRFPGGELSK